MTNPMFRIYTFIYENFLLAQGSVVVFCTKFNVQIGVVDMLVTHANMKGFGLTHLFGDHRGYMPPQLKTNKTKCFENIL